MLRFTVREDGQGELPAIDVDDFEADVVRIGSADDAHVRLPASAVDPLHVQIERGHWRAHGAVKVDGELRERGDIGEGVTLSIGRYRIAIAPAPRGTTATPPQRTESLARELVRSLLGDGAAPSLEIERGPAVGAKRSLAPPESTLVIGRGDEAGWILVDEDLSREHAEVRRSWDGTRVADLDSKNGTKADGAAIGRDGVLLRDGALVELGKVALRFRDPAETHLRGISAPAPAAPAVSQATQTTSSREPIQRTTGVSTAPFYAALALVFAALAGLVWVLSW
jgi:hypothetical protein